MVGMQELWCFKRSFRIFGAVLKGRTRMIKQFDDILEYVQKLCDHKWPDFFEDEEGLYWQPSRLPHSFACRYNNNSIEFMPDKNDFLIDDELMNAVNVFGLDVDKFWMAMLFIYDYITLGCTNAHRHETSLAKKLEEICSILEKDGATLTAKCRGCKSVVVESKHDRDALIDGIRILLELKRNDPYGNIQYNGVPLNLFEQGTVTESDTKQIVFAARLYQDLFELLGVTKIRKRGTPEMRLDKNTLISRLLYITGIARNDVYNLNNERLKKDLKDYKGVKMDTFSISYM